MAIIVRVLRRFIASLPLYCRTSRAKSIGIHCGNGIRLAGLVATQANIESISVHLPTLMRRLFAALHPLFYALGILKVWPDEVILANYKS